MGLVQKGLVGVLQGRSNRYRIGFLSSFESLQRSLGRTLPSTAAARPPDQETAGDWHRDQSDGVNDVDAPDSEYIQRLNDDFQKRFDQPLPHPKIDSVVESVAPDAFGDDTQPGGHKFLIFTRRVSTVGTLRDRLLSHYYRAVENRIRRYWGVQLDWRGLGANVEALDSADDPEAFDLQPGESAFRQAMSKNGWLHRYRQTFRASGRNARFFEDGWLQRLCLAGGKDPAAAARDLPDEIWAESWTHAAHSSGASQQQYSADRVRYLAVQAVRRKPEVFGLDANSAAPWRAAYEAALHRHLQQAEPAALPHRVPALFTESTLWTAWDERFPEGSPMALPGANPRTIFARSMAAKCSTSGKWRARSSARYSGSQIRSSICTTPTSNQDATPVL